MKFYFIRQQICIRIVLETYFDTYSEVKDTSNWISFVNATKRTTITENRTMIRTENEARSHDILTLMLSIVDGKSLIIYVKVIFFMYAEILDLKLPEKKINQRDTLRYVAH